MAEFNEMIAWLQVDLYYFGVLLHQTPSVLTDVKRQIMAWHAGDPKPWAERMFKPYFPNV